MVQQNVGEFLKVDLAQVHLIVFSLFLLLLLSLLVPVCVAIVTTAGGLLQLLANQHGPVVVLCLFGSVSIRLFPGREVEFGLLDGDAQLLRIEVVVNPVRDQQQNIVFMTQLREHGKIAQIGAALFAHIGT